DRIGQLHMRNLDIADTHEKLVVYSRSGLINLGNDSPAFFLPERAAEKSPPGKSQDE
ncbi:MAG TPA: argininosuccinate synthase, partial [Spirochaetia bacterium]|nr:argininosuccinate synthase [Spirochaetia bacterium]